MERQDQVDSWSLQIWVTSEPVLTGLWRERGGESERERERECERVRD